MALKLKLMRRPDADATISRIILSAVKRTGKNTSVFGIAEKVRNVFEPKPLVHVTARGNNRHLDIKLHFPCGARHGVTCDR